MMKHAIELKDVGARDLPPQGRLLTKTLFPIRSAYVHALCLLPPLVLTFMSFVALSCGGALKTFTATDSPFCVP